MVVAISVAVRCEGCIAYHVHDAVKAGATRQELLETLGVALFMGGGPASIYTFVGGFYVAALVKGGRMGEARLQSERLAEVNRLGVEGEWEFNEWCHGRSGQPMGYPHQAWPAGMYVFACQCVRNQRVPILGQEQYR